MLRAFFLRGANNAIRYNGGKPISVEVSGGVGNVLLLAGVVLSPGVVGATRKMISTETYLGVLFLIRVMIKITVFSSSPSAYVSL